MKQQHILKGEGCVYVMCPISTAQRARDAGAISTESRVVFKARWNELEIDPEVANRLNPNHIAFGGYHIPEAHRFRQKGQVNLMGRDAYLEPIRKTWLESFRSWFTR